MLYQRSQQIEARLAKLLRLIGTGCYSSPALAAALGISTPTVSRCIEALRRRGHPIRAIKQDNRWHFAFDRQAGASDESIPESTKINNILSG